MFVIENAKGRSSPMDSSLGFGDDGFILLCVILWTFVVNYRGVFISVPIKTMKM